MIVKKSFPNKKEWQKAPLVREPRKVCQWSEYQQAIFNDIEFGSGNTHVDALAGSGKTATLVEGFYHMPEKNSVLMCAFNKSIKDELETRAPEKVSVKTIHSIGYAACRKAFPKIGAPDDSKLEGYVKAEMGDEQEDFDLRSSIYKAVNLSKLNLLDQPEQIDGLLDQYDIDTCEQTREKFIDHTLRIMAACKKDTNRIDFSDMIWLPFVYNLKPQQFDRVCIDEAQDLNAAQANLALNSINKSGRILSCGDHFQSIYNFMGSDSDSINKLVARCNSKRLPLSITYRCAKSIVQLAQTYVPQIEAAPNAEDGTVNYIINSQIEKLIKPGDFLLSRVNAPLLKWCLSLLKSGVPANIQGRDLGGTLMQMIKKSKCKKVESFLSWLKDWEEMEANRMVKAKRDPSLIYDKAECFRVLAEGTNSLTDVKNNIDKLFHDGDDKNRVILSSIHKSKGMERDNVFVLSKTLRSSSQEEKNLAYVAITRAKKNLYMVS